MDKNFEIGDLVWAKMKKYPPWPAQIVDPPSDAKSKNRHHYVYFLGSNNYAWISDKFINHHSESRIPPKNKRRNSLLQSAIDEIITLSENKPLKENSHMSIDGEPSNSQKEELNNGVKYPRVKSKRKRHLSEENGSEDAPNSKIPNIDNVNDTSASEDSESFSESLNKSDSESGDYQCFQESVGLVNGSEKTPKHVDGNDSTPNHIDGSEANPELVGGSKASPELVEGSNANPELVGGSKASPKLVEGSNANPELVDGSTVNPNHIIGKELDEIKEDIIKGDKPTIKIGFIGAGGMGQSIVKILLLSGHDVTLYNRSSEKCTDVVRGGALRARTPADVVKGADIIFSCVSDASAAKSLIFDDANGVLKGLKDARAKGANKSYVEMTSMDSESSQEIAEAITLQGGKYLEASIIGNIQHAKKGSLYIVASGDRTLFHNCTSCFSAISRRTCFIGSEVGASSNLGIVTRMLTGTFCAAIAESLAIVERVNISSKDFLDILKAKGYSQEFLEKGQAIVDRTYSTASSTLKYQQKDLKLALDLSDASLQPVRVATAANEMYKHAKMLGYSDCDSSAVFLAVKY
ncbi:putative oxidoreductase GLYR1 homolog [Nephila pilipes]|uniref:Cytokine-like nuclear factor N-PAC n=1 Tax=Nephila pilipes TaxID=299642 RepID=A0A8X6NTN7_NEPPI|nr:putative oxidoreductase GLYR1 homolog [Nephila pilipes]